MKCSRHLGFTLVELLVVIGIIAVLATVFFVASGNATDSARSAQCMTNLRSLALAANSYAMEKGNYPPAGSSESVSLEKNKPIYSSNPGWISWLCANNYSGGHDFQGAAKASSHQSNGTMPFYGNGNRDEESFAITNGAIWIACGRNRSLYTCPEHVRYRKSQNMPEPLWSYVMNMCFGYDTKGGRAQISATGGSSFKYNDPKLRAEKRLMFAELPTFDPFSDNLEPVQDGKDESADAILQFEQVSKGKSGGQGAIGAGGSKETIGFPHKMSKGRYCANIVFADGHTEKVVLSRNATKEDVAKLTCYLCNGWDVTITSKGWQMAEHADEVYEEQ